MNPCGFWQVCFCCFLFVVEAHALVCADDYFENTIDLSSLVTDKNGAMFVSVSEYVVSAAEQNGTPRCDGMHFLY